jgi:hypothetical protein
MAICRVVKGGAEVETSRFRSDAPALLNVLLELRWMRILGATEFFGDASQDRAKQLNRLRRRQQLLLLLTLTPKPSQAAL